MATSQHIQILRAIRQLPESDQVRLYSLMHVLGWIEAMERQRPASFLDIRLIREKRFAKGAVCPHCANSQVVRWGRYNGKQRYRCRNQACGRTFNDFTGTPLSHSKIQDKLPELAACMVAGFSIRRAAKRLGISIGTTFRWRHRLLRALRDSEKPVLQGIVEVDDTYFPFSTKGLRSRNRRPLPRLRSLGKRRRGLSRDQVAVLTAIDRDDTYLAEVAGRGQPRCGRVQRILTGVLTPGAVLCSDGAYAYRRLARTLGIMHRRVSSRRNQRDPLFHINHVNSYHDRLKRFIKGFRGVSTKYLPNYIAWHVFVDQTRHFEASAARKQLLAKVCRLAG